LVEGINANVPGVNPQTVISAGATDLGSVLNPEQLSEVLVIFLEGLKDAFIVPIPVVCISFFLALLLTKDMRIKGGIKLAAM
jgi:hypothetical protein